MDTIKLPKKGISIALFIILIAATCLTIKEVRRLSEGTGIPQTSRSSFFPLSFLRAREIETKNKLWLNGYLGQFLMFKYVGYWTWLALPLILVFLAGLKKKKNWEAGLACVYFLSACLIATMGYFNFRYQLTIVPFTLTFILVFGRDVLADFDSLLRVGVRVFIVLLIILSILQFNPTMLQTTSSPKDDYLPWGLLKRINKMDLEPDTAFLECNAPAFYYYTNKKGLSYDKRYLLKKPGILTEKGIDNIFQEEAGAKELDLEKVARAFDIMKSRYKVRYIFIKSLPDYYRELNEIIRYGCDLLSSEKSYGLFRLKDHYIHPLLEVKKRRPIYQSDFSKWQGPATIRSGDLAKTVPPLVVLGYRGEFKLTISPNDKDSFIRISPEKKDENGNFVLFLGYWLNHNGFDQKIQPGEHVVFEAYIYLSEAAKKQSRILVQDETENWEIAASDIDKSGWNQYVVTKKIREKAKDIIFGISWQPENEHQWMELKDVKIFAFKLP